jgi:O-antigen/teichoic acid export membrane protein
MPVFARELQEGRPDAIRRQFDSSLRWFAIAAAVALVAFATPIVRFTYGPVFAAAAPARAWIGFELVPCLFNTNLKIHLYASGRERVALRWSAVALAIQTLGCVILIPRLGALGAAVALVIGEAFVWLPLRVEDIAGAS